MVQVKICGIKKAEDAHWAVNLGADMLGFIFYRQSPRYVSEKLAKRIIGTLPPFVLPVGVFVDELPEVISRVVKHCGLKIVQLHGNETPEYCLSLRSTLSSFPGMKIIKAFRIQDESSLAQIPQFRAQEPAADFLLLDAYKEGVPGGTGEVFNWEIAVKAKEYGPVILSGGLTPENVEKAIETVAPYGVDVATGVEKTAYNPGKKIGAGRKDYDKMKEFIKKAKSFL